MKKFLSLLLSAIMAVSCIAIPLSAQAETKYWLDTDFVAKNVQGLKDYISKYGVTNSDGDKVIQYYASKYDYNFLIIYEPDTKALDFWADYGDDYGYVDWYYAFPDAKPEVCICINSNGGKTTVTFDPSEYNYQDLTFTITNRFGSMTDTDIQKFSNLLLKAAVESWDECLRINTSYRLYSIGFDDLCPYTNYTTSYTPATFKKDGVKTDYCYYCGYFEETTYASIGSVELGKSEYNYTGKAITPSVVVKDADGKTISSDNYDITYQSGRVNPGTYSVKVNFINGKYEGSKTLYFTIKSPLKSTNISSIKSSNNSITATWKKISGAKGYQVQISTSKSFKSKKSKTITTNNITMYGLKSNKKYYVRVRAYKKINGKTICSSWSKVKSIKVR